MSWLTTHPIKTAGELSAIEAFTIIRNPELDKEDNAELFSEEMEKARQLIARAGLPPVKQQEFM